MTEVSIIVPVFNAEAYLKQCIDSILSQTFSNFELLLIDDGSTDKSGIICDEYALLDTRIRVIHKANGGLSDARNVGIDASIGNWLMFIDSDDYINPTMTAKLYNAVTSSSAQMGICSVIRFNNNDSITYEWDKPILGTYSGIDFLKTAHFTATHVIACNKIYEKQIFRTVRYPIGKIHEDEFVIHKLFHNCKKVVGIPDALYYYRQNPTSITGKKISVDRLVFFEALEDRFMYFRTIGLKAPSALVLLEYFDIMRVQYFELNDNKKNRKALKKLRMKAWFYYPHFFTSPNIKPTIKIATFIFLCCPPLYKMIWHREKSTN